jgi:hypothetical protein
MLSTAATVPSVSPTSRRSARWLGSVVVQRGDHPLGDIDRYGFVILNRLLGPPPRVPVRIIASGEILVGGTTRGAAV